LRNKHLAAGLQIRATAVWLPRWSDVRAVERKGRCHKPLGHACGYLRVCPGCGSIWI